jgi:NAD(P)H-dependent FMN reductase
VGGKKIKKIYKNMKITIINGSTRTGSNSIKISEYIKNQLEPKNIDGGNVSAEVLDLSKTILPVYDDSEPENLKPILEKIQTWLGESDGFVFVSPEWDGMFSVGILNLLHYIDKELADKPVFLVSVSSGRGGRYPLLQARGMGYKNKRFVIVPESFFIDFVEKNFVDGKFVEPVAAERLDYDLNVFLEYAKALKQVRASGVVNYEKFPNGI